MAELRALKTLSTSWGSPVQTTDINLSMYGFREEQAMEIIRKLENKSYMTVILFPPPTDDFYNIYFSC